MAEHVLNAGLLMIWAGLFGGAFLIARWPDRVLEAVMALLEEI